MTNQKSAIPEPRRRGRPVKSAVDASVDIRNAALKAFARSGFNGASILEIAQLAGVAKPLGHYHYASKNALWEAAVGDAVADLREEILSIQRALESSASPKDLLRNLAKQLVAFASRHPELVHVVVDETGKGGPRADWLRHNLLMPGYLTAQKLLDGIAGGFSLQGTTEVPAAHIVPAVLGIMNFPFMDADVIREAYGVDVHSKIYVERHGELLFKILSALLRTP
jgi:hypothetical protein